MTATTRRERYWNPRFVGLCVVAALYVYPFVFMIGTALKPRSQFVENPNGFPTALTTDHLSKAWRDANLSVALRNSTISVSIGVVSCIAISSLAAFWFHRHTGRLSRLLLSTFGALWMVPQVIWLISFFILLSQVNLTNNLLVLGIVYGAVFTPTTVWLLWGYSLRGIPIEVFEASSIDGASAFQQYLWIYLPMAKPILGAAAALAFVYGWNDLILSLVLIQDEDKFTVVTSAATLVGRFDAGVQATSAAALLTMIPSLVVFLFAQRAIVKGITAGVAK
jgi:ABC-type glycerol-3-phosphate transport system permease component